MTRLRALALLAVLAVPLASAAPASAQDEATTTTEATTPAEETAPAVVVEIGEEAPEDEAWTFRYLAPTLLALTGVVVAATFVGYLLRVRTRYVVKR